MIKNCMYESAEKQVLKNYESKFRILLFLTYLSRLKNSYDFQEIETRLFCESCWP